MQRNNKSTKNFFVNFGKSLVIISEKISVKLRVFLQIKTNCPITKISNENNDQSDQTTSEQMFFLAFDLIQNKVDQKN